MFIISEFTLRRVGHISKISDTFEGDCCEIKQDPGLKESGILLNML